MASPLNVFSKLSPWQTVDVKGPEARDFLHRLTSANFKTLAVGSHTPGTLLTPTGKISLYFKALRLADDHYRLVVPDAKAAFDALEKLHFRENLSITPLGDEWAYLRLLASDEKRIAKLSAVVPEPGKLKPTQDGRIVFNENRWTSAPIKLDLGLLVPQARIAGVVAILRATEFDEVPSLEEFRLRAFDPAPPSEINETTIPLEASLDDAVHENKGCYPGQEVIERIRSMGQAPRLLVQVRGQGEVPTARELVAGGAAAGTLTSVSADTIDGGWVALGYVKRVYAKADAAYTVASQPVSVQLK
ncbi:MAG: hypothetical protein HY075_03805 [Deltaproteobacteria bacterium]|nr:hypothetical protein [Deltaproteobacteria bacterium]